MQLQPPPIPQTFTPLCYTLHISQLKPVFGSDVFARLPYLQGFTWACRVTEEGGGGHRHSTHAAAACCSRCTHAQALPQRFEQHNIGLVS